MTETPSGQPALAVVPEGVLVQHVEGETVLLHLTSGQYYALDPVGTRMLDLACALPDAPSVVETLGQEYDATPDVLAADLERLLGELAENGLIVR